MVSFSIAMTGNRELGARINKLIKKIDTEPDNTLNKAVNEAQLYAMMIAPKRTGATANSIKVKGGKNFRVLYMEPLAENYRSGFGVRQVKINVPYNVAIDKGTVAGNWGLNTNDRRMIDKRNREDKLNFFVGTESNEGKTLKYVKNNFPRQVAELGRKIVIK